METVTSFQLQPYNTAQEMHTESEDHSITSRINKSFEEKRQLRSLKHYLLTKEVLPDLPEPFVTDSNRSPAVPVLHFFRRYGWSSVDRLSISVSFHIRSELRKLQVYYSPIKTGTDLLNDMCSRIDQGFQPSTLDMLLIGLEYLTLTPVLARPNQESLFFIPQFVLGDYRSGKDFSANTFDQLYLQVKNATLEHLSTMKWSDQYSTPCVMENLGNLTLTTRDSVGSQETINLEIKYDSICNPFCNSHLRMLSFLFDGLDGITIEDSEFVSRQGRYSILRALIITRKNKTISSKTFEWGSLTVDSFTECSKCFGNHNECTVYCGKCDHTGHIEGAGVCIVDDPPEGENPPSTTSTVSQEKFDMVSSSEKTSLEDPVKEAGFIRKFKDMLSDKFK